jgi:hypothetical protein
VASGVSLTAFGSGWARARLVARLSIFYGRVLMLDAMLIVIIDVDS